MQRRDFGKALIGGAVGAALGGLVDTAPAFGQPQKKLIARKNTKMHVGADYHVIEGTTLTSKENLEYNLRFGVKSISPDPDQEAHRGKGARFDAFIPVEGPLGGAFDLDVLKQMKDNCDAVGMWLEALRTDSGYIILKDPSDQDKKLDQICDNVRKAAQVDVRIISYHWTMIPIRRNGTAPGRGDAVYSTFKLENDWKNLPVGMAGPVSYNEYWERIEKFLKRVIPVCAEYKVAMANHPYDPPGLPYGYEGAENFDSPSIYTAYKKYEQMVDSPWNGFQMDLGVIGEGSTDVNRTEPPLVQYMAERGKIKQVHMRNIKGGLNNFQEVYPDEGVIDFFKIMRIFRDTGYEGSFLPDHMPSSPGDPGKLQAYAFGYGYIHALINSVNSEVS
ncbi:MAG TPA: mannonate dehydratase [Acidobacteriaceae bacterium]|nr:mannonate dehydratase [Acidobacteriaceae bacterium]